MSLHLSSRLATAGATTLRAPTTFICTQCRNATLLRRPKRPYTFTQLVALSDGSTFLHRTTSPVPVYRSTRDTRNTAEWNPSSARLSNTENDEAGQLAAFRSRFGGSWDSTSTISADEGKKDKKTKTAAEKEAAAAAALEADAYEYEYEEEEDDYLLDLITGFNQDNTKTK